MLRYLLCLPLFALALPASPLQAQATPEALDQDWPTWRGPHFDGSVAAKGLPIEFGKDQNVAWVSELPGAGASTPIIVGDRIFLTVVDKAAGELLTMCLDRESGDLVWKDQAGSGYQPGGQGAKTSMHNKSNYASPSAVCDGERVIFFFGNGDLVAYDLDGQRQWARNLQKDLSDFTFQWTFSATPTLWEGRLYLPILQRDTPVHGLGKEGNPSFILALKPDTGETIFKVERPCEAKKESRESYATAVPFVGKDGRKELLIVGGDVISGHDPATGAELWRWGTWNEAHREVWWRLVPSTVVGDGVALICAPKGQPVYAVKLGGEGDLGEQGLAWKSEGKRTPLTSDVPTPLFYEDRFFVLSDVRNALSAIEPATGAIIWTIQLPSRAKWRASPTGADGKIWFMNHAGLVMVVDAENGDVLAQVEMGEEDANTIRASIAVARGQLFIRTQKHLYCIGD